MDNKQFPERDEEEIIPEELTFFPADEESEDAGDVPVSEDVIGEEPASQPEEIPAEVEEPVAEETPVAEDVPAFEDDSAQDDIPIFEDVPPIADAPAPEEIPAPDDTSEKGRSFMDRIPDVDDGMEESYDSRLTEPEVGSEIIPDESAMDSHGMLEHGEELVVGVTILMKAVGVGKAYIGIENNKPDAIAHLTKIAAGYKGIEVVPLKVMYPQGGEKQLIAAVMGRQVPPPPALPIDVGAVVCNASTTVAVYQAVLKNKPLIERVVTVTGKSVKEPKNLLTRMGTPISALIEAAGGLPGDAGKVINGGPMMGRAMVNLDSPVTKGCSGITVMSGRDAQRREATQCIKCAKCVSACPMGLEPYYLSKMTQKKGWDELEALMITSCIECGCCQSTCPAYLPLLDWVRLGKQTVMGLIRARAAAAPKK